MRIFNRIIQDSKAPNTFDLWINKGKLKYFDGGWKDLGGSEQVSLDNIQDNPILSNGDGTKYLADDGTYKTINLGSDVYVIDYITGNSGNITEGQYNELISAITDNRVIIFKYSGILNVVPTCTLISGAVSLNFVTASTGAMGAITVTIHANYSYTLESQEVYRKEIGSSVPDTDATETATAQSVATTLNQLLQVLRSINIIGN